MKTGRRSPVYAGLLAAGVIFLLAAGWLIWGRRERVPEMPTLTVETPQIVSQGTNERLVLDVSVSGMGDAQYPAASVSIRFDASRLEFLGVEEGNVFVHDASVGQSLPEWSCSPERCNKTGLINVMYLDMTAGQRAFDRELLAEEDNVLLRLAFRLRGSVRAGDVLELSVEDAVFAASDEEQSLAVTRGTLGVKNGRIVIGGKE